MRTRRGLCYSPGTDDASCSEKTTTLKKRRTDFPAEDLVRRKTRRPRSCQPDEDCDDDFFDSLPDDLVICILSKLGASASSPADFISALLTCKRLNALGLHPHVLSKASPESVAVRAQSWCDAAHRFLKLCADAGNVEACYMLGMIRFYCLQNRGSGASLMAKAAINSHPHALYSLAVIQFNGSGGSKNDKDLRAGVALCARAAFLGHVDALRELGHCLQDGYGVRRSVIQGRRFLVQANARELAAALSTHLLSEVAGGGVGGGGRACPLLSDFGCFGVPPPEAHPANRLLSEWFAARGVGGGGSAAGGADDDLRLCSHAGCGRAETRRHEFRRCSVCGAVNYCSRACQALDWKLRHKGECAPMARWVEGEHPDGDGGVGGGGGDVENGHVGDRNDDVIVAVS